MLKPGPDGEPEIGALYGSGCNSEKAIVAGRFGKELFFVETSEQGFFVLCDNARVGHMAHFARARINCGRPTGDP